MASVPVCIRCKSLAFNELRSGSYRRTINQAVQFNRLSQRTYDNLSCPCDGRGHVCPCTQSWNGGEEQPADLADLEYQEALLAASFPTFAQLYEAAGQPSRTRNSLFWSVGRSMVLVVCLAAANDSKSIICFNVEKVN